MKLPYCLDCKRMIGSASHAMRKKMDVAAAGEVLKALEETVCKTCHDLIGLPPAEHPYGNCGGCRTARATIAKARLKN